MYLDYLLVTLPHFNISSDCQWSDYSFLHQPIVMNLICVTHSSPSSGHHSARVHTLLAKPFVQRLQRLRNTEMSKNRYLFSSTAWRIDICRQGYKPEEGLLLEIVRRSYEHSLLRNLADEELCRGHGDEAEHGHRVLAAGHPAPLLARPRLVTDCHTRDDKCDNVTRCVMCDGIVTNT